MASAERLPPESDLADQMGVSQPMVREATGILWCEGLHKKWGVGTVIVRRGAARASDEHLLPLLEIESTPKQIRDSGAEPGVDALRITAGIADSRFASLLDVNVGMPIWIVDRVQTADGQRLLRAPDVLPK